MVRMGTVWDRSGEVFAGRGGMLAAIAVPTLLLPAVVRAAFLLATTPEGAAQPTGAAASLGGGLLTIAVALISLWGQLALIAAASDPATHAADARRIATARFLPALAVMAVLFAALILLSLPPLIQLLQAGFDFSAPAGTPQALNIGVGGASVLALYVLVVGIALVVVGARLVPLYAVVVNERMALGAIRRSWRLTRRHGWRIVGALLLWLLVLLIATWAAQAVTGLVARLILGGDAQATVAFVAAIAGAIVSTVFSVIAIVFTAQLYVALVARERRVA